MSLSLQAFARPIVSSLAVVGDYFNSINRFGSTFNIAGIVAKEWACRFPNSQSNLNTFVNICSAFNIVYLGNFFSLPSKFNEKNVIVSERARLKPIIELNRKIVFVSSFLCLLNQVELINLSRWATSIGKIPGFGRINQLNMVQSIVVGCVSYSLLSVIHFSNEVAYDVEGKNKKKDWCSLGQSLIETVFYSFLFFAPKYKFLNQPTLIRVMIVGKEFFSGIVLDLIKTR